MFVWVGGLMIFLIKNWKLVGIGLVIALALFLSWHYKSTLDENKRLTSEIQASNDTIEKLDDKAIGEAKIKDNEETIIKRIQNAPKKDDVSILDNAIDDIERLRQSRSD